MTAFPSHLGALLYADEAAHGATSAEYDERLPVANSINDMIAGLTHDKVPRASIRQYVHDASRDALGPQGGQFMVSTYLAGHGSTCATTITGTQVPIFLGRCVGGYSAAGAGTTVATPSSAVQFSVAGGTIAAGGLYRVGASTGGGDGRGNGEFYAINNASTITLLNAMAASASGSDVVYAAELVYPLETAAVPTSMRFNMLTANQRYGAAGCLPVSMSLTGTNPGEFLRMDTTMQASRWAAESASSFPTAVAMDDFDPAPNCGGNVFVQVVGTTTRAMRVCRDITVDIDMQRRPLPGLNTAYPYAMHVGYRTVRTGLKISWTEESETAGTDTLGAMYDAAVNYHIMVTFSSANGSAMGLYIRNAKLVSPRPTQMTTDDLNQKRVTFEAVTGPTVTTDLTASAWCMAFA